MASHWLFSGTYGKQVELRDAFYRGDWTDDEAPILYVRTASTTLWSRTVARYNAF